MLMSENYTAASDIFSTKQERTHKIGDQGNAASRDPLQFALRRLKRRPVDLPSLHVLEEG